MIDSLNGELVERGVDHVTVECHGVGYRVQVPTSTLALLPAQGRVRLLVHYAVTVDVRSGASEHRLFGFASADERALFRRLIEVQGVSTTIGMALLGARGAAEVYAAVMAGDEAFFKGVKGIGPKLAQRIVVDLRERLAQAPLPVHAPGVPPGNSLRQEALTALVSLGVDRAKAERSLQAVLRERSEEPPQLEELIKLTLKNL